MNESLSDNILEHDSYCANGFFVPTQDVREAVKLIKEDIDKNKILESDFQTGAIEFSFTGELIPIEILDDIFKKRLGDKLI